MQKRNFVFLELYLKINKDSNANTLTENGKLYRIFHGVHKLWWTTNGMVLEQKKDTTFDKEKMQKIHENNFSVSKKTNVISNSTESEKYLVWNLNHRSGSYITRNKHVSFPFFIHSQSDLFDAWNDKRNNGITSIKLFEKHLDFVWIFFFQQSPQFPVKMYFIERAPVIVVIYICCSYYTFGYFSPLPIVNRCNHSNFMESNSNRNDLCANRNRINLFQCFVLICFRFCVDAVDILFSPSLIGLLVFVNLFLSIFYGQPQNWPRHQIAYYCYAILLWCHKKCLLIASAALWWMFAFIFKYSFG